MIKKLNTLLSITPTMSESKKIDLTPETAFDDEYKAEMEAKGYTFNDSAHARMIIDDDHAADPDTLELFRGMAKSALLNQLDIDSITLTNKSRTHKEIIVR